MQKKIVAIAGGENGRVLPDGTKKAYETAPMDQEIIKLTGKENPNFLFIGHAQPVNIQKGYFDTMKKIYGEMYDCPCKMLKSNDLRNEEKVKELIEWADIIYEGGGNTLDMIRLWEKTGFDKILKKAWKEGKVLCGVSAGACCWFKECSSDSLRILYGNDQPLTAVKCLGLFNGFFTPHCDEEDRYESSKKLLKGKDMVGLLLSNCSAIEIVDDKYRIITNNTNKKNLKPYAIKAYWDNNQYYEQYIDNSNNYKNIKELLSKNIEK